MSGTKQVTIDLKTATHREQESIRKLLSEIINSTDEKVLEVFNLASHEVNDVKDVIRRSGLY